MRIAPLELCLVKLNRNKIYLNQRYNIGLIGLQKKSLRKQKCLESFDCTDCTSSFHLSQKFNFGSSKKILNKYKQSRRRRSEKRRLQKETFINRMHLVYMHRQLQISCSTQLKQATLRLEQKSDYTFCRYSSFQTLQII